VPPSWLQDVKFASPLAQFSGADRWTPHPARSGVALIGDAAAKPDPFHGCGMSLALRDARVLAENLLSEPDWNIAVENYATEHDRYYNALRSLEHWVTDLLWDTGDAAAARRLRLLPASRPDLVGQGPESSLPPEA
jgi:2-polyprenyl-6-methoxyphenol hydroxylase-like FAD-dependent oxidoreductase